MKWAPDHNVIQKKTQNWEELEMTNRNYMRPIIYMRKNREKNPTK